MRKTSLSLTCLFLLLLPSLMAQNFRPFHGNWTYHFDEQSSGQQIERCIVRLGSGTPIGNDTLFAFNPIARDVMGTVGPVQNCSGDMVDPQYELNQVNTFGEGLIHRQNGDWDWILQIGDTFKLKLNSPVGSNWMATPNLTATLQSVGPNNTFGIPDSIVTISLSNGGLLVISKAYGMVSMPHPQNLPFSSITQVLSLTWIPEVSAGTSYHFEEIFDFNVGDKFGYQNGVLFSGLGSSVIDGTFTNLEVLAKSSSPNLDTFFYTMQIEQLFLKNAIVSGIDTAWISPVDTVNYYYARADYPELDLPTLGSESVHQQISPLRLWDRTKPIWDNRWNTRYYQTLFSDSCHNYLYILIDGEGYQEYTAGLGITLEHFIGFFDTAKELVCYEKSGQTVGTCVDFGTYVNRNEPKGSSFSLEIYPNPASKLLRWRGQENLGKGAQLHLVDNSGKRLHSRAFTSTTGSDSGFFSVESLPNGIYFLQLEKESGEKVSKKFIVSH